MTIELPDLVQRVRVRTESMRAAEKAAARLGSKLDALRASAADTSDQFDELDDTADRVERRFRRMDTATAGIAKSMKILDEASGRTSGSVRDSADSIDDLGDAADGAETAVHDLGETADGAADSTERLGVETKKTGDEQDKFSKKTRKSNQSTGSFIKKVLSAVAVMKLLKIAIVGVAIGGIIGALGQLGSLLVSLTAGATAFVGAMGPLFGSLASAPAGLLAFVSVIGVFKALTAGVGDASKAIREYGEGSEEAKAAMAALSSEQRGFVTSLVAIQDAGSRLAATMRQAALPGLTQALNILKPLIPAVAGEMAKLSSVVAGLAVRGAQMVTSGPFQKDIGTILGRNTQLVDTLGRAFLKLFSALRNIIVAAGPMTQTFADMILQMSRWLNQITATNRANGDMAAFFRETVRVMTVWGHILRDLSAGLFNLFSIGKDLGDDMTKTLEGNARAFRKFTESAKGRNKIAQFFDEARPALRQTGLLFTAISKGLLNLQGDIPIANLLKQIRTELGPSLAKTLKVLGRGGLTEAVIDLANAFLKLLRNLPVNAFAEIASGVATLVTALVKIGKANPIILQVLGSLLLLRATMKTISLVSRFTGFKALTDSLHAIGPASTAGQRGIKGVIQGLRGATREGATLSNKFGLAVRSGFSKAAAGVKRVWSGKNSPTTIIDRSMGKPRGLKQRAQKMGTSIVNGLKTGLKRIGSVTKAGLSRVGKFASDQITKARGGVKKAATRLGGAMSEGLAKAKGPVKKGAAAAVGAVSDGIKGARSKITTAGKALGASLGKGLSSAKGLITGAASAVVSGVGTAFTVVKGAILAATGAVRAFTVSLLTNPVFLIAAAVVALAAGVYLAYKRFETFRNIVDSVFGFLKTAVTAVVSFVKDHWQLMVAAMLGPFGLVLYVIKSNWDRIQSVFQTAVDVIRTVIVTYFNLYKTIIVGAFTAIRAAVSFWWNAVKKVYGAVLKGIGAVVQFYWKQYVLRVVNALQAIAGFVRNVWGGIQTVFRVALAVIGRLVAAGMNFVRERIVEPLRAAWNAARAAWNVIVQLFRDKVNEAVDKVREIRDKISGFFTNAGQWLYNIGRAIIQGLINGITSMFDPLQDALNWVTDKIPDWKGPIGKDQRLLYGAGRAIMDGLTKGIREGYGGTKSVLNSITRDIENGIRPGGGPIEQIIKLVPVTGKLESKKTKQLSDTSQAKSAQARLQRQAQQAAEKENRLRAKLPLLKGDERAEARRRIRELQADQERLLRRAAAVKATADLRQQRSAALKRADSLAKQAANIRLTLPGLDPEAKAAAKARIRKLEEQRAEELQKARDVQKELIKVFRDLPSAVQNILRDAKDQAQSKRDREDSGTGTGGGVSSGSGDAEKKQISAAAKAQKDLLARAKAAAKEENRLRAQLPDLSGEERRKAIKRIRTLQAEQDRIVRRAGSVRAVADARQAKKAALTRADNLAARAQNLRSKLPQLEGEDRRKALKEINNLEKERAKALRDARDAQDDLTEAMKDLPKSLRELIRKTRREQAEKKAERKAKKEGPDGTSSDPVYTRPAQPFSVGGGDGKDRKDRKEKAPPLSAEEERLVRQGNAYAHQTEKNTRPSRGKGGGGGNTVDTGLLRDQAQRLRELKNGVGGVVRNTGKGNAYLQRIRQTTREAQVSTARELKRGLGGIDRKTGKGNAYLDRMVDIEKAAKKEQNKDLRNLKRGIGGVDKNTGKGNAYLQRIRKAQDDGNKVGTESGRSLGDVVKHTLDTSKETVKSRQSVIELRKDARTHAGRAREQIGKQGGFDRAMTARQGGFTRTKMENLAARQSAADDRRTAALISALGQIPGSSPSSTTGGGGKKKPDHGKGGGGGNTSDRTITNITVNNPIAEPASESVSRRLRQKEVLGRNA